MAQVVEGYLRQTRALQEWREGPLAQVRGVDEAAALAREDEALVAVERTDDSLG